MKKGFIEAALGAPDCHSIPFYWQHGAEKRTVSIREKMKQIHADGVRAVCVESRPHPDFVGEEWWRDMDELFACAEEYGIKVWFLDDDHYPTGHANGAVRQHPELRGWHLAENHADVIGPVREGMLLLNKYDPADTVLGVFAYRRTETSEDLLTDEIIDLSSGVRDGFIFFDLPAGTWRIFTYLRTRKSVLESYVDMLNPASVRLLIDEVYEPHYRHYGARAGKTFMGFFSDEPKYKNRAIGTTKQFTGYYNMNIGVAGMALPWSGDVLDMMERALGRSPLSLLAALWYRIEGQTAKVRHAYMDAVSRLYSEAFSVQLGNWCREHGLEYIGHMVEDMGAHARVGNGPGHFFRSMAGQDMSGMDFVLAQLLPGFAHFDNKMTGGVQYADSGFFHYVLPQMTASLAHITPRMKDRALCECFGAYGWAEGVPMMKWMIDFLLVRGINHFVPHGYDDMFPDPDCPPQFGADGCDPQTPGFRKLISYTDRMATLLSGGTHIANAAILYHAEAEWMNPDGYMPMKVPAKALFDGHICYDILPIDTLVSDASVKDGKLSVNRECYDVLIIPAAERLPEHLKLALQSLVARGLRILFVDAAPHGFESLGECVPTAELAERCRAMGAYDITVGGEGELLRHYHVRREDADLYFFFNESAAQTAKVTVDFPQSGAYTQLSLAEDRITAGVTESGTLALELQPYQSTLIIFGGDPPANAEPADTVLRELETPALTYSLSLADCEELTSFRPWKQTSELSNINAAPDMASFSGRIRYRTVLTVEDPEELVLELGEVGQTAELTVNGEELGIRICRPYRFDLSGKLRAGENQLEITVANTLVHRQRDFHSTAMLIGGSGLLGPVRLLKKERN